MPDTSQSQPLVIVYDGECPFCRRYATLLRLRESVGEVELVSAREDVPIVQQLKSEGFDLHQGMIAIHKGKRYYGADAVHLLALLGSQHGWFNAINVLIFRHEWLSKLLYPFMKSMRLCTLRLLGVKPIT